MPPPGRVTLPETSPDELSADPANKPTTGAVTAPSTRPTTTAAITETTVKPAALSCGTFITVPTPR